VPILSWHFCARLAAMVQTCRRRTSSVFHTIARRLSRPLNHNQTPPGKIFLKTRSQILLSSAGVLDDQHDAQMPDTLTIGETA